MKLRRWTAKEEAYLKRFYPRKGPDHCAKTLGRTNHAIRVRAGKLGLMSGVPNGYVPLSWAAPRFEGRGARKRAVEAARRDGVLLRLDNRFAVNVVPEEWADAYAKKLGEEQALVNRTRTWLRTSDIARMLRVPRNRVTDYLSKRQAFGKHLRGVTRVRVEYPQRHYRWHPTEAVEAVRRWRREARS